MKKTEEIPADEPEIEQKPTPEIVRYADIKRRLIEPVPRHLVSFRPVKAGAPPTIAFISITDYKDLLDIRAGVWESQIIDFKQIGSSLCVVVRISIHADDGIFSQDGSGIEQLETSSYGDPFSNAYAQSFRRACEGHGLSRELWRSETSQDNFEKYQGSLQSKAEHVAHEVPATAFGLKEAAQVQAVAQVSAAAVLLGFGAAKTKEAKIKEICSALNKVGELYTPDTGEPKPWSMAVVNEFCIANFDTALNKLTKEEVAVLLSDLDDQLQERLALAEDGSDAVGEVANVNQVNSLKRLSEIHDKFEGDVAEQFSKGRTAKFDELLATEAAVAIAGIAKMKAGGEA